MDAGVRLVDRLFARPSCQVFGSLPGRNTVRTVGTQKFRGTLPFDASRYNFQNHHNFFNAFQNPQSTSENSKKALVSS